MDIFLICILIFLSNHTMHFRKDSTICIPIIMLSRIPLTFLLHGLIGSHAIIYVTATPVQKDTPDALKPCQSEATPNPLDYAPDFYQDPFPPWPRVTNTDDSNITVQNWRGTKLFGWKGYDKGARDIIVETMQSFYTLAQQEALWKNVDWDSTAAKEIWGHATDNKRMISDNTKAQIKRKCFRHSIAGLKLITYWLIDVYEPTQQMYDKNWWVPPYIWDPL